ncbi:MAG: hypothetical protein OEM22_05280, partial [Acidimicrobiia bacterium]|nr:hypothetical protein [Acidimicrobiia bacterium]
MARPPAEPDANPVTSSEWSRPLALDCRREPGVGAELVASDPAAGLGMVDHTGHGGLQVPPHAGPHPQVGKPSERTRHLVKEVGLQG